MALKSIRSIFTVSFIVILFTTLSSVDNVYALSRRAHTSNLPPLNIFISQVTNGEVGQLRGVYISGILAAPVVQQPAGNNEFVSPRQNILTQFNLASQLGSTGLLAHNYLAGENFSLLEKDTQIYLIYGNGQISIFVVTEVLRYQALEPTSSSSNFLGLESSDFLTAAELFSKVYDRPGNVIFQTCISNENSPSWGRLFVIAEPDRPEP